MNHVVPATGLRPARLARSERVLLLVDFINPLDFPGGEQLAPPSIHRPGTSPSSSPDTPRSFCASPLELLLTEMQARELVICGLATDICVQLTAMDAFLRDYRTWVPEDCTAAETPRAKAASLAYIADVLRFDTAAGAACPTKRKPPRRARKRSGPG